MLLLMAAAIPALVWSEPPDTAATLREAGITSIQVPAPQAAAWKEASSLSVQPVDLDQAVKVLPPSVQYRQNQASATTSPWLVSNGWQFLRNPQGRFLYEVKGARAALAVAEAFCFGGNALVHTDRTGLKPFAEMLEFLHGLGEPDRMPVADIGFIDDGSSTAGEVMNMLVRDNLLFTLMPPSGTGPRVKLTVRLGSKEFPIEEAKNPSMTAHEVRARLTDDKRSVRIFGSQVVVARLTALPSGLRVHLLNYAGAERKIDGVRVRVLGQYSRWRLAAAGSPGEELIDYSSSADATEFTLPELKTYAAVDLSR